MKSIFTALLNEMEKGADTVLVTVVAQQGSTPRGTGAQMLVGQTGLITGTIGGGAVERRSIEMARDMTMGRGTGESLHDFYLRENTTEDIGMVCGGDVTVLFQFVPAGDDAWKALVSALLEQIQENREGWLVLGTDGGAPALLDASGNALTGPAPEQAGALLEKRGVLTDRYFSLPLTIGERVIIFGGGHCALPLAPLLVSVGFRVTVMDNRPEFANEERFPWAEQVICGDYNHISNYLTITPEDYAVVMTNGHSHDLDVQAQLLRGEMAYIGVIGSRRKKAAVNKKLQELGISDAAIERVHAPIGTAIKAVTPAEIAVSIAGEMIYERALRREAAGVVAHGCPMH